VSCVAVCCSVLQCCGVCRVLQCVAVCCNVAECVVCCSVLQCSTDVCCAVCCRVSRSFFETCCPRMENSHLKRHELLLCWICMCYCLETCRDTHGGSVSCCVAVCCSVLQCVAVCCSVLHNSVDMLCSVMCCIVSRYFRGTCRRTQCGLHSFYHERRSNLD